MNNKRYEGRATLSEERRGIGRMGKYVGIRYRNIYLLESTRQRRARARLLRGDAIAVLRLHNSERDGDDKSMGEGERALIDFLAHV